MNIDNLVKKIDENNTRIKNSHGDHRPIQENYDLLQIYEQKVNAQRMAGWATAHDPHSERKERKQK